jgi:hypothetical protein
MMTLCLYDAEIGKWAGCSFLLVAWCALAGWQGGRVCAADAGGQNLEKQIAELRGDMAEIKKSLEVIKKLIEAMPGKIAAAGDRPTGAAPQAKGSVQLTIRQVDNQSSGRAVEVEVTVVNGSAKPLAWDREFGVFMDWHVTTDKGADLKPEHVADVQRDPDAWKSRFVTVEPGKSLSKRVDLTGGFLDFFCGVGYSPTNPNPIPFAYQQYEKYVLPEGTGSLTIQVEYRGLSGFGHPEMGFVMEFGRGARGIGLQAEGATSNTINVPVRDVSP